MYTTPCLQKQNKIKSYNILLLGYLQILSLTVDKTTCFDDIVDSDERKEEIGQCFSLLSGSVYSKGPNAHSQVSRAEHSLTADPSCYEHTSIFARKKIEEFRAPLSLGSTILWSKALSEWPEFLASFMQERTSRHILRINGAIVFGGHVMYSQAELLSFKVLSLFLFLLIHRTLK